VPRTRRVGRGGGRGAGPAVRVRLTLRARDALRRDRHLSGALPAIGPAGRSARDAGGERGGGAPRRRGAIPALVGAPVVRQSALRSADPAAAAVEGVGAPPARARRARSARARL